MAVVTALTLTIMALLELKGGTITYVTVSLSFSITAYLLLLLRLVSPCGKIGLADNRPHFVYMSTREGVP